jgi:exosome complex component CSL4
MALVLPGDVLGRTSDGYLSGSGTYVSPDTYIRASLCGQAVTDGGKCVSVVQASRSPSSASALVPEVGQLVLARVLRISPLLAQCELLLCEGRPTAPYSGVLRREHVRDGEVDLVRMEECFLPGDIVHAMVASLGDARSFFLSTVAPTCGVVAARAEVSGLPLRAVSATEMEDPTTGARERRRVAVLQAPAAATGEGAAGMQTQ